MSPQKCLPAKYINKSKCLNQICGNSVVSSSNHWQRLIAWLIGLCCFWIYCYCQLFDSCKYIYYICTYKHMYIYHAWCWIVEIMIKFQFIVYTPCGPPQTRWSYSQSQLTKQKRFEISNNNLWVMTTKCVLCASIDWACV